MTRPVDSPLIHRKKRNFAPRCKTCVAVWDLLTFVHLTFCSIDIVKAAKEDERVAQAGADTKLGTRRIAAF